MEKTKSVRVPTDRKRGRASPSESVCRVDGRHGFQPEHVDASSNSNTSVFQHSVGVAVGRVSEMADGETCVHSRAPEPIVVNLNVGNSMRLVHSL